MAGRGHGRVGAWFALIWMAVFGLGMSVPALASITVLVGEPFGNFGTMMPVGHAAIYLDRVCADGPLRLRMCRQDEPQGVVVARYHRIGNIDWLASPVLEFLYAIEPGESVPEYVTPDVAWSMRERYRERYLRSLVPDGTERAKATDEWWESAGVAFNRRLWGYELETTPEQDRQFVQAMNERANRRLYHLRKTNCANFAADMVNLYFPRSVHQDRIADFGLMTPKQVARCVAEYGRAHPEVGLRIYEVPQLPGSLRRSRPVRGGAEAGLKTKRYLATLLIIQPEVPAALSLLYLTHGRWKLGDGAAEVRDWTSISRNPVIVARMQTATDNSTILEAIQSSASVPSPVLSSVPSRTRSQSSP